MQTRVIGQSKAQASSQSSKKLLMLAAAGGAAFWITDFVIVVSPISQRIKLRSRSPRCQWHWLKRWLVVW